MRILKRYLCVVFLALAIDGQACAEETRTYAERLGWPAGARVVIFHSDDLGMSHQTNQGTIKSLKEGIVTSTSTMMPTPWVPGWMAFLEANPDVDNGLHLTLTSEWDHYRWGPVAGKPAVPTLVDKQGCLWDNVGLVNEHGTPDDVEKEIRAQIDKALEMGMPVTHMDSHMGTLFSNIEFYKRYVKVGIEYKIPMLITGPKGHLMTKYEGDLAQTLTADGLHEKVWEAGLPVLDDATGQSYGWKTFDEKKKMFTEIIKELKPGVTEIIVHCTIRDENFDAISPSGETRQADLDVSIDPEIIQLIKDEGIILTTWRELKERRDKVK